MKACLFGSTGVIAEKSRLERLAYNAAFKELDLDVYWNVATYCKLLEIPGGLRRLETVFGDEWLAGLTEEVFELQQNHFERLARTGLSLRPGVAETLAYCTERGIRRAWVTTASRAMIKTLLTHTEGLNPDTFELVLTREDAARDKPDPSVYRRALEVLNLEPQDVIAIEDSPAAQASALAADIQCYLYASEYALIDNNVLATHDLAQTIDRVHRLWSGYTQWAELET